MLKSSVPELYSFHPQMSSITTSVGTQAQAMLDTEPVTAQNAECGNFEGYNAIRKCTNSEMCIMQPMHMHGILRQNV